MKNEQTYFKRSVFTEGMLLHADDLENQHQYEIRKRNLMNRVFLGWGIVYGLQVRQEGNSLILMPGLALDSIGREIFLPHEETVSLTELFQGASFGSGRLGLCLSYAERPTGKAVLIPVKNDPHSAPNRMEERYRLFVRESRREDDICIAVLYLQKEGENGSRLAAVNSPVDGFHSARFAVKEAACTPEGRGITSGTLIVHPDSHRIWNGVYYSDELSHGLGRGPVEVTLSMRSTHDSRVCCVSGDPELFHIPVRWAVRVFPETGSFMVAIRCEKMDGRSLQVDWRACRMLQHNPIPAPVPQGPTISQPADIPEFQLDPSFRVLLPGETFLFTLCPSDAKNLGVFFSADGGRVEQNGSYTAPDKPGVYHVNATLSDGTQSTALVLVNERGEPANEKAAAPAMEYGDSVPEGLG